MALPSPTVAMPETDRFIAQAQARASGLADAAWARLQSTNAFNAASAAAQQAPEQAPVPAGYASSMYGWSQGPQQQQGPYNTSPDYAGFADNVPRSLIGTESGGNWGARNNEAGAGGSGHYGILQFGPARYSEAVAAGAVPKGMTIDQFGSDTPEGRAAQISAANWHFNEIDSRIRSNGYDKLVGQSVGGVPITMDGMRSMAHLGGFGGLSKFISSGGGHNPADSFGTSLAKYGTIHAGY